MEKMYLITWVFCPDCETTEQHYICATKTMKDALDYVKREEKRIEETIEFAKNNKNAVHSDVFDEDFEEGIVVVIGNCAHMFHVWSTTEINMYVKQTETEYFGPQFMEDYEGCGNFTINEVAVI